MALSRTGRTIFSIVGVILIAAILFGLRLWNKPRRSVSDEVPIQISPDSLLEMFTNNEKLADSLYLNKAIRISGIVQNVDTNADGKTTVLVQTNDPLSGVFCTLRNKGERPVSGAPATLEGFCSGFTMDVVLTDCVLLK